MIDSGVDPLLDWISRAEARRYLERAALTTEQPFGPRSMDEAVDWLRKSFRPDAAADLEVAYRFELDGPHGPDLELRVISGRLEVGLDEPGTPDVVFRLSSDDFYGVLAGRENPDLLFMDDRLVVDGDLSLALQLRKLFGAPA